MKHAIAIAALVALPLAVNAVDLIGLPAALSEKVSLARQACGNVENGGFAVNWGAVTRTDLDGDLHPD